MFHLPIAIGVSVDDCATRLRQHGVRLLAADGSGARELGDEATEELLGGPSAWLFGNEAWGLAESTRRIADHVVRVPVYGRAESLNLATAAAVCLYASARQQRQPGGCRSAS